MSPTETGEEWPVALPCGGPLPPFSAEGLREKSQPTEGRRVVERRASAPRNC